MPGQAIAAVPEAGRGARPGREIDFAYRDLRPPGRPDAPVVVLVHGSPVASSCLDRLAESLRDDFRIILPDLPGFGGSEPVIADYSIEAHGKYLAALLSKLDIRDAHLVGFSMGGGVVLHTAAEAPGRTASVVMLSAIGVQEHELLGDYTLNHAIHGLQLGALWLATEATPHFGTLDNAIFSVRYARNFFDTDQRPLRGLLEAFDKPMLVFHGLSDVLVPIEAAREHARIVPQSEAAFVEGGHLLAIRDPDRVAAAIRDFIVAGDRPAPTAERLAAAAEPPVPRRLDRTAGGLAMVMALLALATLASEDLTCISAGLLVAKGLLGYLPAAAACLIGIFVGDLWLFLMGRWFGYGALRRAPVRWFVREERIEHGREWFLRHGAKIILASRFLPGTRLPTYFGAGAAGVPLGRFIGAFLLSAILWTPALVGLSSLVGGAMLDWFEDFGGTALWGVAAAVVTGLVLARIVPQLLTWKGRRLLLSRWRRLTRWEFWPAWAVYPPVVAWIVVLMLRHRSMTVFTAANPAIPCGGLVMESKLDILRGLEPSGAVARFARVATLTELRDFLRRRDLGYPVALKPDVGERGQGVAIIHDEAEARRFLESAGEPVIAQEFIPGHEFGVFYVRHPDEERGRVIAVTDKRLLSVTGDGTRTLEELILADDRAVCMAHFFLHHHRERLEAVPAAGAVVPLTELGTHARGALFLDGTHLVTPRLEEAVDRIGRASPGFHFGRFDIRTPDEASLRAGRDLTVLELNGISSEPTNIYDPRHGLFFAWRQLARTWTLCFRIGAANRDHHGARPATLGEILERIRQFRHKEPFEAPLPSATLGSSPPSS